MLLLHCQAYLHPVAPLITLRDSTRNIRGVRTRGCLSWIHILPLSWNFHAAKCPQHTCNLVKHCRAAPLMRMLHVPRAGESMQNTSVDTLQRWSSFEGLGGRHASHAFHEVKITLSKSPSQVMSRHPHLIPLYI